MVKIKIADSLKLSAWVTATVLLVNWLLSFANLEVTELFSVVGATGITPTIGARITNLIGGIGFVGVNFQSLIFLFLSALAIVVVGTYAYDWIGIPRVTKEWQRLTAILAYGTIVFLIAFVGLTSLLDPQVIILMVIYYAVVALTLGILQKQLRNIGISL